LTVLPASRARRWALIAVLLVTPPAGAQPPCDSTESCLRAIETAQARTQTISARFTQTKHLSLLDEPLVSTGRFVFKRPDRMRLEVESPRAATILIKGREITIPGIPEADRQQLAMTPMASMFSALGAMFGGSAEALQQHFRVAAVAASDGIEVTLTPTVPEWQRLFTTIRLRFTGPDLVMSAMRFDDPLGDRLEIVMSDVQRNEDVPDALFAAPATPTR
jgi:outer membrane lipoprotein-sorting protein